MKLFTERLKLLYSSFGIEWIDKNAFVFSEAKECGLALAGSIGGAVVSKKAKKLPGDIDFVAKDIGSARRFMERLQDKLLHYPTFWQIRVNHQTKFCPENVDAHFRFDAPFWLPICVFVLKDGCFRQWFTKEAYPIQYFDDIKNAANELEKRDGKPRPLNLEIELDDDLSEFSTTSPKPYQNK